MITYGEIINLGRHKLMCGDATNRNDVMKLINGEKINLVFQDPPYGVKSIGVKPNRIGLGGVLYDPVIGDTNTDMAEDNYKIIRSFSFMQIIWGGQNFTKFLPPSCGWIFWDKEKNTEKLSFGDGELAWCNKGTKIKKYSFKWNGVCRDGDKNLNEKVHPNQKPVELHAKILQDFSSEGDNILDCFGGSGTTLIACELTGRNCFMMEIEPDYCQIIIERYHKLKDREPLFKKE